MGDEALSQFQVLGADKATGAPRRMVIEAPSPEAARALARSRGMLISVIEPIERATVGAPSRARAIGPRPQTQTHFQPQPQPKPKPQHEKEQERRGEPRTSPEPRRAIGDDLDALGAHQPIAQQLESGDIDDRSLDPLHFPGRSGADIALLPGEQLLHTFEAGRDELGIFASAMGHRRRVVVTTGRVVLWEKYVRRSDIRVFERFDAFGIGKTRNWLAVALSGMMLICGMGLVLTGLGMGSLSAGPVEQLKRALQQGILQQAQTMHTQQIGPGGSGALTAQPRRSSLFDITTGFTIGMGACLILLSFLVLGRSGGRLVGPIHGWKNQGVRIRRLGRGKLTPLLEAVDEMRAAPRSGGPPKGVSI